MYQSGMFELDEAETKKTLDQDISAGAIEKVGPIFGVIGIMFVNGEEFLCTINRIEEVAIIWNRKDKHGIYLVKDVKFLPIMDPAHAAKRKYITVQKQIKDSTANIIAKLEKYLKDGFYFSRGYDLTANRQKRIQFEEKIAGGLQPKPVDFLACDPRYFWNRNNYQGFRENNISVKWYTPVICGYVGYTIEPVGNFNVEFVVISRRHVKRAGTRLNVRGLDDDGNVANQVETEQIVKLADIQYSYVITRGSVPVFWSQSGKGKHNLYEDVNITRDYEMTQGPFKTHFKEMIDDYHKVHIVDLLKDSTDREARLTKEYYKLFYDCEFRAEGTLSFLHFDFHRFTKGDQFTQLKVMIGQLNAMIHNFGFFAMDLKAGKVLEQQKGVFRVNCLDSIDRTNVAQSTIGLTLFQKYLQSKLCLDVHFGDGVEKSGIAFSKIEHTLINDIKSIWRNNGDFLSRQYTGTDSTISKVSEVMKEGFWGKVNHKVTAVQRLWVNTVQEN